MALRYHDPRRFGMVFWSDGDDEHERVANSGVEPLGAAFGARLLAELCATTSRPVKLLLMDSAKIAGIGNIYASEALFRARISPLRPASKLARAEAAALARSCKAVLRAAIKAGGSSLRDHRYGDDRLGYFQLQHRVYGRESQPCPVCSTPIVPTSSSASAPRSSARSWPAMKPPELSDAELERYSRHIMLDEIGLEGQARIKAARVLLVGAGGLGCPAAHYLAAAGVGVLTVCDGDQVELANLQRQLL